MISVRLHCCSQFGPDDAGLARSLGAEPMKYGLDLMGGVHFLMQVDTDRAVLDRLEDSSKRSSARSEREMSGFVISPVRFFQACNCALVCVGVAAESRAKSGRRNFGQFVITQNDGDEYYLQLAMTDDNVRQIEDFAVQQNLQTIRNRVNELGVSDPWCSGWAGKESSLISRCPRHRRGEKDSRQSRHVRVQDGGQARCTAVVNDPYDYEGRSVRLERDLILRGERVFDAQVGFDPDSGLPQVNITLIVRRGAHASSNPL